MRERDRATECLQCPTKWHYLVSHSFLGKLWPGAYKVVTLPGPANKTRRYSNFMTGIHTRATLESLYVAFTLTEIDRVTKKFVQIFIQRFCSYSPLRRRGVFVWSPLLCWGVHMPHRLHWGSSGACLWKHHADLPEWVRTTEDSLQTATASDAACHILWRLQRQTGYCPTDCHE